MTWYQISFKASFFLHWRLGDAFLILTYIFHIKSTAKIKKTGNKSAQINGNQE